MKAGKKWTQSDTVKLIYELERICWLWDVFHKEYLNREKRAQAYKEVAELLGTTHNVIKSKIAGLRTQLGQELSKTNTKRSGQGTSENYQSNWVFVERIQFLRQVMVAGKSKDTLSEQPKDQTNWSSELSHQENNVSLNFSCGSSSSSNKKTSKRAKVIETRKAELLPTCVEVLKESSRPQAEAQQQCPFTL